MSWRRNRSRKTERSSQKKMTRPKKRMMVHITSRNG
jgi:hypothetical protein